MSTSYHRAFDPSEYRVCPAVIEAMAERAGTAPSELPPLFEVIEPDALEALFQPMADGVPRDGGTVVVEYAGYEVSVSLGDSVDVTVSSTSA